MNVDFFIAKRLFLSKDNNDQLSKRIVNLAILAIGLGIAVIIIATAIVNGFQKEIEAKVDGFAAHAQIINLDGNLSYQTLPIKKDSNLVNEIYKLNNIAHIQEFATKPGIVKVDDEIQGVIVKGISKNFDWSFFEKNIIEGEIIPFEENRSNKAWISKTSAQLLKLSIGDKFIMYFINEDEKLPRTRQFELAGIYNTGLEEFDKMFMLIDIRHLVSLNNWSDNYISGYEVFVEDLDKLSSTINSINSILVLNIEEDNNILQIIDVRDKYAGIFDWLGLLDLNSILIQVLMILVAGFNMISGLLVIILERTRMIGILKSLGATNLNIRKVFIYLSGFLIFRGLMWGNIFGISICIIQKYLKIIPLDSNSYYIDAVPINIDWVNIVMINMYTFIIISIMLVIPSLIISKISPEKTIKFD